MYPVSGRRTFLATTAASLLAPRSAIATATPSEFQQRLTGPICSVPTPYREDFSIDFAAIKRIVECGLASGVHVFAMTAGNSQYDRLTYPEIKELTAAIVKAVKGRGMVIAATGAWWTGQCVDYARYAESIGADALQVLHPPFGTDDTLFEHYRKIAAATRAGLVLHGQVPLPLLKRLLTIDQVAAYKEEYPPMYSVEVFSLYKDRLNIFAGGQKSRYLMFEPYGMKAYYSTFSTFAPRVPQSFWQACQKGERAAALAIVEKQDVPFFSRFSFSYWRATLEIFGMAERYLRPPEPTFTAAQVAELRPFFKSLGL